MSFNNDNTIQLVDFQREQTPTKMDDRPVIDQSMWLLVFGILFGIVIGVGATWLAFILSNPHALYRNDEFHAFNALLIHKSGIYDCKDSYNCILIEPLNEGKPCVCGKTLDINSHHHQHTTYWHLGPINGTSTLLSILLS